MAFSLNRAQVIGNLTRDPELRQTNGGQSVCSFGIATNDTWIDKSGQKQERADFHNIVFWGKLAEFSAQYLKKGRKVFVEGRMQTRDWEGADGQKRSRMEVVGENLILLDRAGAPASDGIDYSREANSAAVKGEGQSGVGARGVSAQGAGADVEPPVEAEVALDDLPF